MYYLPYSRLYLSPPSTWRFRLICLSRSISNIFSSLKKLTCEIAPFLIFLPFIFLFFCVAWTILGIWISEETLPLLWIEWYFLACSGVILVLDTISFLISSNSSIILANLTLGWLELWEGPLREEGAFNLDLCVLREILEPISEVVWMDLFLRVFFVISSYSW